MTHKRQTDWQEKINQAESAIGVLTSSIEFLTAHRDGATAEIAQYLKASAKGIELDLDAIKATPTRPYTTVSINENEAFLIHWRGVKMPIFGWVVAQEPAFIKSKVTRSTDLITPLPQWMKDEFGWKPPEHKAVIDGARAGITLNEGDEGSFKRKYGQFIGGKQADGTFKIKGGDAWIKLVAALVKDGILPYQPKPVAKEHWDENAQYSDALLNILESLEWKTKRPYLERAVEQWLQDGASLFNIPPSAGKSLIIQMILTKFKGKTLLVAGDNDNLRSQWKRDLPERVPNAKDVTITIYQDAQKYKDDQWDFVVFDECQRIAANQFSKLAFINTLYRAGATGTAWREDERQYLIVALCGRPFHIPWNELMSAGVLKKPRITVATVKNEAAKTDYVKKLLSKRKGNALVFCDFIERGKELANSLDVPFIYGETKNKLQKITESDVCVVSRVADRGVSLRDLRLVIEVAGAGKSREQLGQRLGRLFHGEFEGEFHTVFTPEEAEKYRGRFFGVEAELAGEVDIEFVEVGAIDSGRLAVGGKQKVVSRKQMRVVSQSAHPDDINRAIKNQLDEISVTLELPAITAKVAQVKKGVGQDAVNYVERVLRYCWTASLSPKEISEGLALTGHNAVSRLSSACKGCAKVGLMSVDSDGRYKVNQDEIGRLKALSSLRSK